MIKRFRRGVNAHPRLTAMIVVALFAAMFAVPVLLNGTVDLTQGTGTLDFSQLINNIVPQLVICTVILLIVAVLGWWRQTHLTTRIDQRGLRLSLWIIAVPTMLFLVVGITVVTQNPGDGHGKTLVVILMFNLLVGVFEETLFRGVVFHGLRERHSLWVALIGSAVLFGVFHLVNLAIGQAGLMTILQVVNAAALGLFFAALVLQSNSLWPAIVFHAVWNSYAMSGQMAMQLMDNPPGDGTPGGGFGVGPFHLIVPVLLTLAAVWIIRRWQRRMVPPIPAAGI